MIVIGIDPGSRKTGFGVIEQSGNRYHILDYGTIKTKPKQSVSERLAVIYAGLQDALRRNGPEEAAIEEVFYSKNPKSAITLGQARGVALLALQQSGIPIYEYAARRVKQSMVGNGAASKEQVQYMVKKIFNAGDEDIPEDAADALAIAFCHSNSIRFREKVRT